MNDPLKEPRDAEVKICIKWLSIHATRTRTIRKNRSSSYGYKHVVERWADTYITNEEFIKAAHLLGYYTWFPYEGPDAYFNFTVNKCEIPRTLPRESM